MRGTAILTFLATTSALFAQQPYPPQPGPEPADQPGQAVARLGVINGEASARRGDSGDWVAAVVNAPLMAGDSVSTAPGGSVEIQLDYSDFLRVGGDSEIRISQLDYGRQQIQVARGLLTWRVLREPNGASPQPEISTPQVAVHPQRLSEIRVEVASDGSTRIISRRGDAEVTTPRGSDRVHEGSMMLVRGGQGDPEYQIVYAPARDGWDTFNDQRDAYLDRAQANVGRYVSPDINGAEDLSANGTWGYDPAYGNVWTPSGLAPGWAPYQNGQWVWEDYYGWTWIPYDNWGWAPFHYGWWYVRPGFGWTWFPGPRYGRLWYRPAMVSFFGFGGPAFGVGFGFGNVGWVALAPYEVFHPWYGPGWYGGGRFGIRNEVLYNTNIMNAYRNARVSGGVVAVSAADFERGAFRNQIAVNRAQLLQGSLVRGALPVTPTAGNLRFSDRPLSAAAVPRNESAGQRFFSRMPAPAAAQRTPFVQQQAAIRSTFGAAAGGPGPRAAAPSAGWSRFGTPSSNGLAEPQRPLNSGGNPAGTGWDRFGAPQRQSAPPPAIRPDVTYSGGNQNARQVQVAPQIVQPRLTPAPSYRNTPPPGNRSAPPPSRSAGGHSNGGHGGGGGRR